MPFFGTRRPRARAQTPHAGFASDIISSGARWWCLVTAVGVVSGLAGAGYVEAMRGLSHLLGPSQFAKPVDLAVLTGVGAVIGLLTLVLGSPGDVELLVDNIHVSGAKSDITDLRSLIPVSLIGIAAGSPAGPEAPLVQTTGSIASWISRRDGQDLSGRRVLTITGMAAGFAVLFAAPIGSGIFALEILHRRGLQYYEALLPAALGALSGWAVSIGITNLGFHPIWHFPPVGGLHALDLAVGVAAGCVGAAIAAGFTYASKLWRLGFRRLPAFVRPAVGGLALAGLFYASPYALTYGEGQIQSIASATKIVVGTLLLGALIKLLASSMILSSGWRGGFIIPMFFIGVALGAVSHEWFGVNRTVAMAALMAAAVVGVTKTPLGSTLVVAEIAGLRLLPPVLLASLVALFLTSRISIIETQRAREGAYLRGEDDVADVIVDAPPGVDGGDGTSPDRRTTPGAASS
ncbi:MAG TPA: chloride channel protein [Acidimicrobiia bacterium]|nr:chloride channel protein [Acidimicrobiia bacterium]